MGSSPVITSRSVGDLLRKGRQALALTLREASERAAAHGEGIPPSTLVRIEQGRLDPGIRRLAALLRAYDLAPDEVAELAELESWAVEPPEGDLASIVRQGAEHWRRGEVPQALAHAVAVRRHVPRGPGETALRQRAALNFAVFARGLGRLRIAERMVDDLLCEGPEPPLLVDALILAASLWTHRGGSEVALALLARAEARLSPEDLERRARLRHQEAKVHASRGDAADAERAIVEALAGYGAAGAAYDAMTARVLRAGILEALGRRDEAIAWAAATAASCEELGHARIAVGARLELARLLMAAGRPADARATLALARDSAEQIGDRNAAAEAEALATSWSRASGPAAGREER